MNTPAESMKGEDPPLTAADLDRLAYEWSERRVVFNGVEFRAKQDAARTERLVAALPSLLALARRGLEADREIAHARDGEQRARERFEERANHYALERDAHKRRADMVLDAVAKVKSFETFKSITLRTAADGSIEFVDDLSRAEAAESKLAAALAEVERLRGRLERVEPLVGVATACANGRQGGFTWLLAAVRSMEVAEAQAAQAQGGECPACDAPTGTGKGGKRKSG